MGTKIEANVALSVYSKENKTRLFINKIKTRSLEKTVQNYTRSCTHLVSIFV